jgi:hypothetical protein
MTNRSTFTCLAAALAASLSFIGLGGHAAHLWFTGGTHSAARSHPLGRGP